MNYLRSFFKKKKQENIVVPQNEPLPLQIMNFRYLHNNEPVIPRIRTNYFQLKLCLEKKYQACENWTLAYSTYNNGYSLKTMHMFISAYKGPFLFIIQECNGNCFGVFFEESLEIRKSMFGRKSTFLYKIDKKHIQTYVKHIVTDKKEETQTKMNKSSILHYEKKEKLVTDRNIHEIASCENKIYVIDNNNEKTTICGCKTKCKECKTVECCKSKVNCQNCYAQKTCNKTDHFEFGDPEYNYIVKKYLPTDKNSYFCNSSPNFLAFGCSDGFYGLLLNNDLQTGESHCVETFDNEVLASNTKFIISEMEVWNLTL